MKNETDPLTPTTGDLFVSDEHIGVLTMLPAQVGWQSLICVGGEPPYSWANYFSLASGERVVNMWAENLEAAVPLYLTDGMVKVRRYDTKRGKYAVIVDERLPEDWLYNKFCFTGCMPPPRDVALDMYSYYGDPDYEYEQFIDPMSYYAKRGARFSPAHGFITYDEASRKAGETYRESPRFKMEGYHAPLEIAG